MENFEFYLGIVAGTLTTVSFLPQVIKVWRTRSARDLSAGMFAVFATGVFLWLTYGILKKDAPIVIANSITLVFAATILLLKIRYK